LYTTYRLLKVSPQGCTCNWYLESGWNINGFKQRL